MCVLFRKNAIVFPGDIFYSLNLFKIFLEGLLDFVVLTSKLLALKGDLGLFNPLAPDLFLGRGFVLEGYF